LAQDIQKKDHYEKKESKSVFVRKRIMKPVWRSIAVTRALKLKNYDLG
jgi:hypothetical protein